MITMRESKAKQPHKTVTAIGDSIETEQSTLVCHTHSLARRAANTAWYHNSQWQTVSTQRREQIKVFQSIMYHSSHGTGRVRYRLSFQSVLVICLFVRVLLTLFAYHAFLCCSTRPFVTCRVLSWLQSMWLCHSFADKCMATIEPLI